MSAGPWQMWAGRCGDDGIHPNTPGFVYAYPDRWYPEGYGFTSPVAVTVTEDPEGAHVGWIDAPEQRNARDYPQFIFPVLPEPHGNLFFNMCFTYGPQAEVEAGKGRIVYLRVEPS